MRKKWYCSISRYENILEFFLTGLSKTTKTPVRSADFPAKIQTGPSWTHLHHSPHDRHLFLRCYTTLIRHDRTQTHSYRTVVIHQVLSSRLEIRNKGIRKPANVTSASLTSQVSAHQYLPVGYERVFLVLYLPLMVILLSYMAL